MSSKLCSTCLSQDRNVAPLDLSVLESLFGDRKVCMKPHTVCWECRAVVRKLHNFKLQVLHVQEYLQGHNYKAPTHTSSLSQLKPTQTKLNDICCEESDYMLIKCHPNIHTELTINETEFLEFDDIKSELIDNFDDVQEEIQYVSDKSNQKIKKEKLTKKRKKNCDTKVKKTKKITVENENDDKLTLSKENYTIIYMNDEEMEAKRELDRQSKRYRVKCKYKCEFCLAGFLDKDKYDRHMKTRHSEEAGKHQCWICKIRFVKENNYREHISSHYRKYQCRMCLHVGHSLAEMALHDATLHAVRRFTCKQCNQQFSSAGSLKFHRSTAHAARVECATCGKMFKAKKYLTVHMQMVHSLRPAAQCVVCGVRRRHMAAHMLKHRDKPEAAYCAECDLRFASIPVYKNHLKFAKKHRPPETLKHPCVHCDAKFVNSTALRKHVMVRHSKERPYKCDRCDKSFDAQCRLRAHVSHAHDGVQRAKDKICHICGRGFTTKFMLSNHIRVHTGEKPFRCDECPAAFSQKSSLATHTRGVHLHVKRRARDT